MGLGAVFNHKKAVFPGKRHYRIHIAGPTRKMNAYYRPCTRTEDTANGLATDILGVAVYVGKHRDCATVDNAGGRGQKSPGRDHHLMARANPQTVQGQIKGNGAVGQGNYIIYLHPG